MYSYMLKHTTTLPYRSISLYILTPINLNMGTQTFSVKITTIIATLVMALAMFAGIMTKQLAAAGHPKHRSGNEVILLQYKTKWNYRR
jgi:hypothetical protein